MADHLYMPVEDRHLYSERMGAYSGSAFGRPTHGLSRTVGPLARMAVQFAAVAAAGVAFLLLIHMFGAR